MHKWKMWLGWALILLALLANFGLYTIFPIGGGFFTLTAVLGAYLAFRHGRT